jgi:hypothetical protein
MPMTLASSSMTPADAFLFLVAMVTAVAWVRTWQLACRLDQQERTSGVLQRRIWALEDKVFWFPEGETPLSTPHGNLAGEELGKTKGGA